jgi:uncharacterized protein YdeI (YjbR/CyaY-like superfamily)
MPRTDPRVDAYIARSAPFAQPILKHIRDAVHTGCPEVEETMKWSFPHFVYKGMLCSMASFKAHCAFGFWKGSLLGDDVPNAKSGEAMGQFGRITSLSDLPSSRRLAALVRRAAALNDKGIAVVRPKRVAKAPLAIPADFKRLLQGSKKVAEAFAAFSPSHQREYLEWFSEAKTAATRERRMATAFEWISEGKGRNWKYEKRA